MATITVSFALDDKVDRDLKRWLDSLPRRGRSRAIRDTLRAGLSRGNVTLSDVYQAVMELERKLQNGVILAHSGKVDDGIPEADADVLANLDKLGL